MKEPVSSLARVIEQCPNYAVILEHTKTTDIVVLLGVEWQA